MSQTDTAERWSRGRLQRLDACPACGDSSTPKIVSLRTDNEGLLPDTWRQVQCQACHSIYLDPRPDRESIHLAYSDYYTHQEAPELGSTADAASVSFSWQLVHGYLNARFGLDLRPSSRWGAMILRLLPLLRRRLDHFARHVPENMIGSGARLLDVGCGNGGYLRLATQMGLDAAGIEPDPKAALLCRAQGLKFLGSDVFDSDITEGAFDIITLGHVIEHVDEPDAFLRRLHALLKPGGLLWLATPNPESATLRYFGSAWMPLHPPFHLLIPSREVLSSWVSSAGFDEHWQVPRGSDSPGTWCESLRLYRRKHGTLPWSAGLFRLALYAMLLARPQLGEETILIARKRR